MLALENSEEASAAEPCEDRRIGAPGVRGPDHMGPLGHCIFWNFILSEKGSH